MDNLEDEEQIIVNCNFCDGRLDLNKEDTCYKCGKSHFEDPIPPSEFQMLVNSVILQLHDIKYDGDLSDLGNEIGVAIGEYHKLVNKPCDIKDFISGIKHGISLTNGTH